MFGVAELCREASAVQSRPGLSCFRGLGGHTGPGGQAPTLGATKGPHVAPVKAGDRKDMAPLRGYGGGVSRKGTDVRVRLGFSSCWTLQGAL